MTLFDSSGQITGQAFPYETYQATGLEDLVTNSRYIVNKRYSDKSGFTFIDIVDKRIIAKKTDRIRASINNIIAVCLALAMGIGLVSAFMLSKRIKRLVRSMKDVESGKLDTQIYVGTKDEIGYLEQSFSTMCAKLAEYIQNVYIFEIKTKTAELNALQAQIDPHFLFNTLESIRMTALINKDAQTAKMIHILGDMFRWNIKAKGIVVNLKEEIDYVRSYIELQKLRYNNAFDVAFRLESNLLNLGVLKLTLQPIVENAIQHGMKDKTADGLIVIAGSVANGKLTLSVTDNGNRHGRRQGKRNHGLADQNRRRDFFFQHRAEQCAPACEHFIRRGVRHPRHQPHGPGNAGGDDVPRHVEGGDGTVCTGFSSLTTSRSSAKACAKPSNGIRSAWKSPGKRITAWTPWR